MGENSKIGWTDHTFNPWWGCVEVSPACDHCYARTFAKRTGHQVWGKDAGRRRFGVKHWTEPEKWNAAASRSGVRQRVFSASMADVFEDYQGVEDDRQALFALIERTPMLDWLLLTKRPSNILRMVPESWRGGFPANVWAGTTAENDEWLDVRARYLMRVPARVRFISYEPAMGPLSSLRNYQHEFQWVIAGGESGHGRREPDANWFRETRDICAEFGIPFFFKQWGDARDNVLDGVRYEQFPV